MRTVEILVDGKWVPACWNDLQVGVRFRLLEEDGTPVDDGKVCVVTGAARPTAMPCFTKDPVTEERVALGPIDGNWIVDCYAPGPPDQKTAYP